MADVVKARTNAQREETPYMDDLPPDVGEHDLSQIFRKLSHMAISKQFTGLPPATKPYWGYCKSALIAGPILEEYDDYVKVRNSKTNRKKNILRKDLLPCAEVGCAYREISTGWWYVVVRRTHLHVHIRCLLTNCEYVCFSYNHICFAYN